ncbi:MAG: flavodoxin [Oscillibacter sp.]|nr:flavodoxin [Oscillibacter sp.]
MKIKIICASTHHGNTRKLAEHMARCTGAKLVDIAQTPAPDLTDCDLLGFASGVYFGDYHKDLARLAETAPIKPGQRIFLVHTCGMAYRDYARDMKKRLTARGALCVGCFHCRGYDTYAIWGKIGGIAKGHPNSRDLENAERFIRGLIS